MCGYDGDETRLIVAHHFCVAATNRIPGVAVAFAEVARTSAYPEASKLRVEALGRSLGRSAGSRRLRSFTLAARARRSVYVAYLPPQLIPLRKITHRDLFILRDGKASYGKFGTRANAVAVCHNGVRNPTNPDLQRHLKFFPGQRTPV